MKAIAIYSGKGGVGKSTISALLALALSKKHKVALVDMDVNTPSVPVLFGGKNKYGKNLRMFSYGYGTRRPITMTGKIVRKALMEITKEAKAKEPDVIIMDMPPGTGDIQLEVATKLKPSSFVLVIQPNKLSEEDALRATALFQKTNVPISGVIRNMSSDTFGKDMNILDLPILADIPLRDDVAQLGYSGRITQVKDNPLLPICEELFEKAINIDWEVVKAQLYESTLEYEELIDKDLVSKDKLKFYGTKSWDIVRRRLQDYEPKFRGYTGDEFLEVCTAEMIKKMLEHLDDDKTGIFMITKAPNTQIRLFPGEIGVCSLSTENKYWYGVPRVLYHTDEGDVTLFPHEVKPVTAKLLLELERDNEIMKSPKSSSARHLPTIQMMEQLENLGWEVGIPHDWREHYERLGMIA